MKRVYCLYRVSDKSQVNYSNTGDSNEGDIPMQERACREFADRQEGWEIVAEIPELGVSGFKKSAKDRDKLQDIQKAAVEKKFDILLVFMFDRIGRIDSETPFIVEWFINNGIEVWSVNEGQQRLDSHTDKLLNYIRYWQAAGESLKTSVRVKGGMEQAAREGNFYGGRCPYGYRLVRKGRVNKKGNERYDLETDPCASEHVKTMFQKYVYAGFGILRIRDFLLDGGVRDGDGKPITESMIRSTLKNKLLVGIMECGEASTEVPALRILDDDLFHQAQKIRAERANEHQEKRRIPLNTRGQSLLSGNVFCGCCGGRLTASTSYTPYTRKDGTVNENKKGRYTCQNKARRIRGDCNGQSVYSAKKLDGIVSELLVGLFQNIKGAAESELIEKSYQGELESCKAKLKSARAELKKQIDSLKTLQGEVVNAINGTSKFDSALLNDLIRQTKEKIDTVSDEIHCYESELQNGQEHLTAIKADYQRLISWAQMFQDSNIETKKMITAYLIESVKVKRGYELDIQFNVAFEQFFNVA